MRMSLTVLLISGMALGQSTVQTRPQLPPAQAANTTQSDKSTEMTSAPAGASVEEAPDPNVALIPAGTKVPLQLKQAISTKNAREGDPVYAATAFPFVLNDRILIPAGTYIQGKISHTEHAGRSKKRAELLIHFTSMIYPSGYTVMLPGYIENTPGADDKSVKDTEGTIQQDKDTGKRVEDAAKGAAVGGTVGSIAGAAAGGFNGARYGGLAGIAGGVAWALLKHGPEVKLEIGTSLEMEIQRDVKVDASRIQMAKAQ
jgi:type IV secretion system protein VirB10